MGRTFAAGADRKDPPLETGAVLSFLNGLGIGPAVSVAVHGIAQMLPWTTAAVLTIILLAGFSRQHGLLKGIIGVVDAFNEWLGHVTAWLCLGCVLVCFAVVVLRYVFELGFVWLQELYVWQHAAVFMVGAGYTFLKGGHVRVDLFYSALPVRGKAWVDLIGSLVFLVPWLVVLVVTSAPFVGSSWRIHEWSQQADGLPGYFVLKSVIWVFAFVVGAQGLAMICRSLLVLSGHPADRPGPNAGATPSPQQAKGPP